MKIDRAFPVRLIASAAILITASFAVWAQSGGKLIDEVVHAKTLENTVTKENPDRNVSVYLPPGYENSDKRYPVLYLLHGIGDTNKTWLKAWQQGKEGYDSIPAVMNRGIANGKFGEFIVVMPDERTKWFGSFYVNSSVTGNWADFTAKELVAYIDGRYRTIADREHRAVAGHSMGGYGALTIAMKHPEVFSAAYGMNPALMDWGGDLTIENPAFRFDAGVKSFDELLKTQDIYKMGLITVAQAFSPNPSNPPFYCDLPFKKVNGKMVPNEPAFTEWAEHSPVKMVVKYRANLSKLKGYRFDSGYEDEFRFIPVISREFSKALTNNGIDHTFEEYNGDHRNRLWGRRGRIYNEVMPFIWDMLSSAE